MRNLDLENYEVEEIDKAEMQNIDGGSWLSYRIGYAMHKFWDMTNDNAVSPWNTCGK